VTIQHRTALVLIFSVLLQTVITAQQYNGGVVHFIDSRCSRGTRDELGAWINSQLPWTQLLREWQTLLQLLLLLRS